MRCREHLRDGYRWVVDLDLEKFFDTVNQSRLIQILGNTIKDGRVIFVESKRAAQRVKESVSDYIEKKLNLKVNRDKTQAVYMTKMKFLGFSFYQKKKDVGIRVHPKTLRKLKEKVKDRTGRSDGKGEVERIHKLNNMLRGWLNYYRIADMAGILKEVDAWMRSRIRMWYWKQWKKIKTRFKNLMKLGESLGICQHEKRLLEDFQQPDSTYNA